MCEMFPRQQVRWGLQIVHGGLEVIAEEVWGKYPGFPGEKVELVHGVRFKYTSGSAKVISLVQVPVFSPEKRRG